MAKAEQPDRELIETYEAVTISCLPIAAQIRHHFPVIEGVTPPKDLLLPVLLKESQLLHALAVPPLRDGIRGTAANLKLLKKVEALQEKLKNEQRLIHYWHDQLVEIHNDKEVAADYSAVIDQLNLSAQNLIKLHQRLKETRKKVKQLTLTQQIVAVTQDREWVRYEAAFVEAVIEEMNKHQIQIDEELKENVIKKRTTLDSMLEKFKNRNFPIPKDIADGE